MGPNTDLQNRITKLKAAFVKDGYTVNQAPVIINGKSGDRKIGLVAESSATIGGDPNQKKKAYYVEGAPYDLGYLMGRLAKDDMRRMAYEFVDKIIFAFINVDSIQMELNDADQIQDLIEILGEILVQFILYPQVAKVYSTSVPPEIQDEIQGMMEGCRYFWPCKRADLLKHLKVLNIGVDVLCAFIYALDKQISGDYIVIEVEPGMERKLRKLKLDRSLVDFVSLEVKLVENGTGKRLQKELKIKKSLYKAPIFCNAFSVSGAAAGGGHYFGRDFMFPTAGVYQDVAALIIYNPDPVPDTPGFPLVSVTAPGFAGSIAAMNINGVAAGVDMCPAENCNSDKLGLNSLPMVRYAVQHGGSAMETVGIIQNTTKGVSWIYPISAGTGDQACIIEAGAPGDPLQDVPPELIQQGLLPSEADLPPGSDLGYQVRRSTDDSKIYYDYIDKYNRKLAEHFNKPVPDVTPLGFVDVNHDHGDKKALDHNCPSVFYFAPPRWTGDSSYNNGETIITTNHYVSPIMRLYGMSWWLFLLDSLMHYEDDSQWRYDELNYRICAALGVDKDTLKRTGAIDYDTAKQLIEFLAPYPSNDRCYKYYNPGGADYKTIVIGGCISIFDLKKKTVETHAGYYGDEWIKITLGNYFPK